MTKVSDNHEGNNANTLLPTGQLRERVLSVLQNREGKFTAVDIANDIGYPLKDDAVYPTCPNVRRMLTKLCKEGILFQWITGNGRSPFGFSKVPTYDVNYLRRDSNLAKILIENPNRILTGYRIR